MNNKWQMNRAGLLNYWYYDEEEFQFAGGRLLLRGGNGSGKSVTMQSLITVLLDGVKSPDRLDSFGSRSRRMEDYLLGEKEIVNREERTGYLFLEYKREQTEQYMTTGIGLHAKRNGSIDFWGFAVTDGRRLGHDMRLYKRELNPEDGSAQHVPLSRTELEKAIGAGGQVVRSQREYMELVNRHVFGFKDIEQYQELMKLLIQLRSPKLSKDFKPSVIYEILNESLPSLSDDELRPLSDTIESMERTKLQIEQLERDHQSLSRLCRQYDTYNAYILAEKAELLQKTERRFNRLEREGRELTERLKHDQEQAAVKEQRHGELEREQSVLEAEKLELEQHDVFRAEQQMREKEGQLRQNETEYAAKTERHQERKKREQAERDRALRYEHEAGQRQEQMQQQLEELEQMAAQSDFAQHGLLARELMDTEQAFSFEVWRRQAAGHLTRLDNMLVMLRRQDETRRRLERTDQELGEERLELDKLRVEHRKLEQQFGECREALLAEVYEWQQRHQEALPLDKEELRQMAQAVQGLYEGRSWQEIQDPLDAAYGRRIHGIHQELGLVNAKIKQTEEQEKTLTHELNEWRQQRDPEPDRPPDHVEARSLLTAKAIPFVPLYAAVEFNPEVTPLLRERIEAALTDMGLLDALIIPAGCFSKLSGAELYGAVIRPDPQIMTATLADYVHPTPPEQQGVAAADIDEVLRSIRIDDRPDWTAGLPQAEPWTVVSPDSGAYCQGVLSGRAARREAAVYIGKQARQEYRRRQIERLEAELSALGLELEELYSQAQQWRNRQEQVKLAKEQFPGEQAVLAVYQNKQAVLVSIKRQEEQVQRINERRNAVAAELQALRDELRAAGQGLQLPPEELTYQTAVALMRDYQQLLHELEMCWQAYLNLRDNAGQARQRLEDLCAEADLLRGELLVLEGQCQRLRLEIAQMETRLREMGAEELRGQVRRLTDRLLALPAEKASLLIEITTLHCNVDNHEQRLRGLTAKTDFSRQMIDCCRRLLHQELRLGLVYPAEQPPAAGQVLEEKGQLLKQDKLDRTSLAERLSKSFAVETNVLMEYRMQLEPLTAELDELPAVPADADEEDGLAGELERLREKAQRQLITLDYDGRRQDPYQLQQAMGRQIEDQKTLLSDKDKELYEEVIMNSIGRIISHRIRAAQQWVEDMNQLMQQRDNSSGLRFKLEWKARTTEQEEQMDTQDLVRLLHADPAALKEEDLQRIVRHFQSRIEQAKQASETDGSGAAASFQQAVRNMLDYRLWFQFKLSYVQEDVNWRELSDKAFFKFSGGEKAMAMYIPLFSAVYSRYQEAGTDAPYVITLDEAFAGVDENNIRDTFQLVEQLGFNYIMNSQALWGDYDVVPALAVCELIRPKNAPYVTVVRYHWNGRVRSLVNEEIREAAGSAAAATQEEVQ